MKKIFKKINCYYCVMEFTYNCDKNKDLIKQINNLLNFGINRYVKEDKYYSYILFNNDVILHFWNENKYYAWCQHGEILQPNGDHYRWNDSRMNIRTMARLLYYIKNYENNTRT